MESKGIKMKNIILGASLLTLTTGCASVMTAEQQTITVSTTNNKAIEVTVDDKTTETTGAVTVLRDGKDKVVRTKAPNCDTTTVIKKNITPSFFGNIVIGGLLGSTTDASTGKMWDYEDVEVRCTSAE